MSLVFEIVSDEKQAVAALLGNRMKSEDMLVDTFLMICYTSKQNFTAKDLPEERGGHFMKGSETRMTSFMEGADKRYIIPVYQRKYDWKQENCRQLYEDLKKVCLLYTSRCV